MQVLTKKKTVRKCELCGKEFIVYLSQIKQGRGRFCSKRCALAELHSKKYLDQVRLDWTGRKHSKKAKENMRRAALKRGNGRCNKGYRHSEEAKIKMSICRMGARNPNWKGGVTPESNLLRKGLRYRKWRDNVYKRDNYTCQVCGIKSGCGRAVVLCADHIKPWAIYPKLRFDIDNGKTLCVPCHRQTVTFGYSNIYR